MPPAKPPTVEAGTTIARSVTRMAPTPDRTTLPEQTPRAALSVEMQTTLVATETASPNRWTPPAKLPTAEPGAIIATSVTRMAPTPDTMILLSQTPRAALSVEMQTTPVATETASPNRWTPPAKLPTAEPGAIIATSVTKTA